jgi:lactoylglutathione lyase
MAERAREGSPLDLVNRLNDVCLFVKDFEAAKRFYTEKMGFKIKRHQKGYAEFDFRGSTVTIWDEKGVAAAIPPAELGPVGHHFMLAVRVSSFAEVDAISDELIARGVLAISRAETYEWGSRAAYFKDCEGNIWEIFAWEEADGPGLLDPK